MTLPPWFTPIPPALPEPEADARIHLAASDPAFPARREAAILLIRAALERCATAAGFAPRGQAWARSGPNGTASFYLQRDLYGWHASIRFGFQPAGHAQAGDTPQDLGDFYTAEEAAGTVPGALVYVDILAAGAVPDLPLRILAERALPFIAAQTEGPPSPA